ncbi:MAG: hypothetical protein VKP70_10780 [Cyanobacteriota bacterium]|nr:hypothetical protein [Cyanobacteriota bacterium]
MQEPVGPAVHPLGAIQANLEQQIPLLYRELALYLQVLREVLPSSLDQACAHMATQVHPRRYNRLPSRVRQQLHGRLRRLTRSCCSLLTVEQLQNLARQMARERERLALRERADLARDQGWLHEASANRSAAGEDGEDTSDDDGPPLPLGSIQLNLSPPLTGDPWAWPLGMADPSAHPPRPDHGPKPDVDSEEELEPDPELSPWPALLARALTTPTEAPPPPESLWSDGQLPRDPVLLVHWLEGLEGALARRLRNLSHSVNMELMRAGLLPAVVPVRLLDSVLSGQLETQGAPANLLRLPLLPQEAGRHLHAPLGVLLRLVDLEMEQPRLRTCRRRLLHHRQELLKMAETTHRLQRRLQAQHAERLWRHDSQLNRHEGP